MSTNDSQDIDPSNDHTQDVIRDQKTSPAKTRAEAVALRQAEYKKSALERARAARKAYLARPDVVEKIRLQKEKHKALRKQKSALVKAAKKAEKSALAAAKKSTRAERQATRDKELSETLTSASGLTTHDTEANGREQSSTRPTLTLIYGGLRGDL